MCIGYATSPYMGQSFSITMIERIGICWIFEGVMVCNIRIGSTMCILRFRVYEYYQGKPAAAALMGN